MRGLMMDYPLTIPAIVRRVETLFSNRKIVSRRPDRTICRTTYGSVVDRVHRLGVALQDLGIRQGDRVATLSWASQEHLEAYLAIPAIGAVLHTLNLRLHPEDLTYIINDAADRVLIVDESLLPLYEKFRERVEIEHVVVIGPADHLRQGYGGPPKPSAKEEAGPHAGGGAAEDVPSGFSWTSEFINYETLLAASDPSRYVEPSFDEQP